MRPSKGRKANAQGPHWEFTNLWTRLRTDRLADAAGFELPRGEASEASIHLGPAADRLLEERLHVRACLRSEDRHAVRPTEQLLWLVVAREAPSAVDVHRLVGRLPFGDHLRKGHVPLQRLLKLCRNAQAGHSRILGLPHRRGRRSRGRTRRLLVRGRQIHRRGRRDRRRHHSCSVPRKASVSFSAHISFAPHAR